jgi:hypothetical protein
METQPELYEDEEIQKILKELTPKRLYCPFRDDLGLLGEMGEIDVEKTKICWKCNSTLKVCLYYLI